MTAPVRILPDGTQDYSGADYMDLVKEVVEGITKGTISLLNNVSGTNTITAEGGMLVTEYTDGMRFALRPANNNTSGPTLNIDGVGAKAIRDAHGDALAANALVADRIVEVMYVADQDEFWAIAGIVTATVQSAAVVLALTQSNNTAGGTATSGSDQTYPLNTALQNDLSGEGAAVSGGDITLPAGTYDFYAAVPFHQTGNSRIRLYNQTDGALIAGQSCASVRATTSNEIKSAVCYGRFTIASTKTLRLRYRVASTRATDGLGTASNFSETETYGVIMFTRPAEGGSNGVDGADGVAGLQYLYSTTTADADPGNGIFRMNNATLSSVTQLYLDDLENRGGGDVSALIAAWPGLSDSTVKGYLWITGVDDPTDWAQFELTGITDATGYTKIDVTYVAHSGTFANGQKYGILFVPKGEKGDIGLTGATGPNLGMDYQWSTGTSGDPGAGYIRGDNATVASITSLGIADVDRNASNQESIIQFSDNSSSTIKAIIRIVAVADRSKWVEFALDSVWSDQTGYWTADVTYIGAGSALANDDIVSVLIFRTGDAGGLQALNNLSDVDDIVEAAENLGVLQIAEALSELSGVAATARDNIQAEPQKVSLGEVEFTGSDTLELTDAGKVIKTNSASANNLTVPPNGTVAFALRTKIDIYQYGAGQTTLVPGSGVTIRSRGAKLKFAGQYAGATLYKIGTNEWIVWGDLTT